MFGYIFVLHYGNDASSLSIPVRTVVGTKWVSWKMDVSKLHQHYVVQKLYYNQFSSNVMYAQIKVLKILGGRRIVKKK